MPHARKRFLQDWIADSLTWSPMVGVYGLRQVGKSTLVKDLVRQNSGEYESLDRAAVLDASQQTPELFCKRSKLLCLDEVQKAPWLFPVMKDLVGTKRKPGQFLLTGSVRFTLKKEIREALTGRILLHELLPFNLAEAHGKKISLFLQNTFTALKSTTKSNADFGKVFGKTPRFSSSQIAHHAKTGGMPIPCFTRDTQKRSQWFESYFETLLSRDLPLVDSSLTAIPYREGISFLRQLSLMQGREIEYSSLSANTSLRSPIIKKIVQALLELSLIDLIPSEHAAKKSVKKLRIEWKDVGLWNHFVGIPDHLLDRDSQLRKVMIAQELRSQINQITPQVLWNFYKNRDGATIPWILHQGQSTIAITHVSVESPKPYDYRALKNFIAKKPNRLGIVIGAEKSPILPLAERIWLVPYTHLF